MVNPYKCKAASQYEHVHNYIKSITQTNMCKQYVYNHTCTCKHKIKHHSFIYPYMTMNAVYELEYTYSETFLHFTHAHTNKATKHSQDY